MKTKRIKYYLSLHLSWIILIVFLLSYELYKISEAINNLAKTEARTNINKDQAIRLWAASHGGVYVRVDSLTQPNPALSHIPERDITTPSGKKLTLMNPAYLMRQLNENFAEYYGVIGHLTSKKLLRPENKPDEWELNVLNQFETGIKEISEFADINGEPYLRLMQPLFTKQSCLKCHGHQNYKVGDIRGGISISIPMKPIIKRISPQKKQLIFMFSIIWFTGFLGLFIGFWKFENGLRKQEQAEKELKENEEKYRALFERESDAIFIYNPDNYKIIDANESTLKMYGYDKDELIGMSVIKLSAEVKETTSAINKIRKDGEVNIPYRLHKKKDGTVIHVEVSGYKIKLAGKNVMFAVSKDISKRVHAEEELRLSEDKFRVLYNNSPDMYASVAPDDNYILLCNETLLNNTGYLEEEIIGSSIFKMYHEDCIKEMKKAFKQFDETGDVKENELILKRKDGSKIDVSLNLVLVKNAAGEKMYSISSWRDITQKKKSEAILAKQYYQLSKAQELGKIGYWEMDVKKNKLSWTEENHIIFGIPIYSELTYEIFLKQIHPDDKNKVDQKWKLAIAGNEPYDIEYRIFVNNKTKWLNQKADLIFDNKGNCVKAIGFTQDITERKNIDQKILDAIIKTEEDERERISRDIHDGVSPMLSAIKIYVQSLKKFDKKDVIDELHNRLELTIDGTIESISEISNNLSPHILRNFGLVRAIENFINTLKNIKNIEINFKSDNIYGLKGNIEISLYRITTELINNTIKHSTANRITIRIKKSNEIEYVYTDNGQGFDIKENVSSGMGLFNLTNRIESIKGSIHFLNENGVKIEIRIPLK